MDLKEYIGSVTEQLGWVGVNYGYWIIDPHLGTFLWPPTINLRTIDFTSGGVIPEKSTDIKTTKDLSSQSYL